MNVTDNRKAKINEKYDVVVVGGGIAGVSSAVASARNGAKTLIIEKTAVFGGLATIGLISWYEPLCDCHGKQMTGGIAEELLKLSIKYGFDNLSDEWKTKTQKEGTTNLYATYYSPSIFALAIDEFLTENGVDVRLDTLSVNPVMKDNVCEGVLCETIEGKEFFPCSFIVDATGDASIFYRAGAPCVTGGNYLSAVAQGFYKTDLQKCVDSGYDSLYLSRWITRGSSMDGEGHEGKLYDGTSAKDETEYLLKTRKMIFDAIKDDEKSTRDISRIPMMPTFRTIRHIVGEKIFSAKEEGVEFKDSVGSFADFRQKGKGKRPKRYHLPFSALYNKNFGNMISAGRIISCDEEGWEITRVIPVASLSGQAGGTVASLCARLGVTVNKLDYALLRKTLEKDGVLFEN